MNSVFTIAGGLAGFTQFGLRGMLFGLLIGHALDFFASVRIRRSSFARKGRLEQASMTQELLQLLSITCGRLAALESPVNSVQLAAFKTAISKFNLKRKFEMECMRLFALGTNGPGGMPAAPLGFHESVIKLAGLIERTQIPPEAVFGVLKSVVDSRPTAKAKRAIEIAAEMIGLSAGPEAHSGGGKNGSRSENGGAKSADAEASPYQILGCRPSDDLVLIKKRYHELLKEYHPDQIQSLQLPSGFVQFANEQVRKLTDAYQSIAAEKGRAV